MKLNILIDSLPTTVMVGGREFVIASDFRTGILYEQLIQDPDIDERDKVLAAIQLYFPDERPQDIKEAAEQIIWFYSCGRPASEEKKPTEGGFKFRAKRVYDYDEDAGFFYAAFLTQYGIDLQDIDYLHWWKFHAMFMGLTDEHVLTKIMEYRSADLSKIKNKAEKERYLRLQQKYKLPDLRSRKQKQSDVGSMFGVFAP